MKTRLICLVALVTFSAFNVAVASDADPNANATLVKWGVEHGYTLIQMDGQDIYCTRTAKIGTRLTRLRCVSEHRLVKMKQREHDSVSCADCANMSW